MASEYLFDESEYVQKLAFASFAEDLVDFLYVLFFHDGVFSFHPGQTFVLGNILKIVYKITILKSNGKLCYFQNPIIAPDEPVVCRTVAQIKGVMLKKTRKSHRNGGDAHTISATHNAHQRGRKKE